MFNKANLVVLISTTWQTSHVTSLELIFIVLTRLTGLIHRVTLLLPLDLISEGPMLDSRLH